MGKLRHREAAEAQRSKATSSETHNLLIKEPEKPRFSAWGGQIYHKEWGDPTGSPGLAPAQSLLLTPMFSWVGWCPVLGRPIVVYKMTHSQCPQTAHSEAPILGFYGVGTASPGCSNGVWGQKPLLEVHRSFLPALVTVGRDFWTSQGLDYLPRAGRDAAVGTEGI